MRLKIDGSSPPTMAIYTNGNDDPFSAPLSHLSRVKIHSGLSYLGVRSVFTGTLNSSPGTRSTYSLPSSWPGISFVQSTREILAAHGLSYAPAILAWLSIGGEWVPTSVMTEFGFASDPTHLFISVPSFYSSRTFGPYSYEIWCLTHGFNADGTAHVADSFAGVEWDSTGVRCGQYDSDNRYLYEAASGGKRIPIGRTTWFGLGRTSSNEILVRAQTRFAGYTQSENGSLVDQSPFPTLDTSTSAQYVTVDK